MANKKMAVALATAISLTIISAGCGKVENVRVNPAVTAEIQQSTGKQTTTNSLNTTTSKKHTSVTSITDVSQSVSDQSIVTEEQISGDNNQDKVTQAQIEAQGPGPVKTPSQQQAKPQPEINNDPQQGEIEPTYINGILIANKTYALPKSYAPGGLTSAADDAFTELKSAAAAQGLTIWNQSGYRSYETQERLYNNYVQRDGKDEADTYSARPGHSEHQTGLAIDLNSISMDFENTSEFAWVSKNCYRYGFIIRYPKGKESVTGYQYEPWHLRYLGVETATAVYNSGLCLEEYLGITSEYAD